MYMAILIRDYALKSPDSKPCHYFKSHFWEKLTNQHHSDPELRGRFDFTGVKNWRRRVSGNNIFHLGLLFLPINERQSHWTLIVINFPERRIWYIDPMGGQGQQYLDWALSYVRESHAQIYKTPLPNPEEWSLTHFDSPRQGNGYDCGVFGCAAMHQLLVGHPIRLGQEDMPEYRKWIALTLLRGSLPSPNTTR